MCYWLCFYYYRNIDNLVDKINDAWWSIKQGMEKVDPNKKAATSMYQSFEWGIRIIQASFLRITDRSAWKEMGETKILLKLIVRPFNLHSNIAHINWIRNTFMPELDQEIDLEYIKILINSNINKQNQTDVPVHN